MLQLSGSVVLLKHQIKCHTMMIFFYFGFCQFFLFFFMLYIEYSVCYIWHFEISNINNASLWRVCVIDFYFIDDFEWEWVLNIFFCEIHIFVVENSFIDFECFFPYTYIELFYIKLTLIVYLFVGKNVILKYIFLIVVFCFYDVGFFQL